jgi:hypothetical protein
MQTTNIVQLLEQTLNPALLQQAETTLKSVTNKKGFITNLLVIADSEQYNISIRISSLVFLKNALID